MCQGYQCGNVKRSKRDSKQRILCISSSVIKAGLSSSVLLEANATCKNVEGCIVHAVCMHAAKVTGNSTHRRHYYYQGKDQKSCFLQPEHGNMLNVTHAHSLASLEKHCLHKNAYTEAAPVMAARACKQFNACI